MGFLLNIVELAYLRLFHERVPCKTPEHVKLLLFLLHNGKYFTEAELRERTHFKFNYSKALKKLEKGGIVQREGCLYSVLDVHSTEVLRQEII